MSTHLTYITAVDTDTKTFTLASMPASVASVSLLTVLSANALQLLIGADGDTLETLSDQLDDILEDTGTTLPALISAGTGTGLYSETITVNDGDGLPLDGVLVQVATDSLFANVVRSGYTNNLGQVTLNFDAIGTYYGRAEISDFNVSTFTVTVS